MHSSKNSRRISMLKKHHFYQRSDIIEVFRVACLSLLPTTHYYYTLEVQLCPGHREISSLIELSQRDCLLGPKSKQWLRFFNLHLHVLHLFPMHISTLTVLVIMPVPEYSSDGNTFPGIESTSPRQIPFSFLKGSSLWDSFSWHSSPSNLMSDHLITSKYL